MIDSIELMATVVEASIYILFLAMLLTPRSSKKHIVFIELFVGVALKTAVTYLVNAFHAFETYEIVIYFIVVFSIAQAVFKESIYEKIAKTILSLLIGLTSSLMTAFSMPLIMNTSVAKTLAENGSAIRIFSLVFAKTLQLLLSIICALILKKIRKKNTSSAWLVMSALCAGTLLCSCFNMSMLGSTNARVKLEMNIAMTVCLIVTNIYAYYLFVVLLKKEKEHYELDEFLEKTEGEIRVFREREKKHEEVRALKHELRNEYLPIREMLHKGDYNSAEKLLTKAIGDLENELKREDVYETGIPVLDAIVNYYYMLFMSEEYTVEFVVNKIDKGSIDESKISSILINILKNAYEATTGKEQKYVCFEMSNERKYLRIMVKNSIDHKEKKFSDMLMTTKVDKENHGFGIKSIKKISESLNGIYSIYSEEGEFVSEVLLPLGENHD